MFAFAVLLLLDSFRYFSDFQCANLAETLLRFSARALTHTRKAVAQRLPRLLELGRRSFYEALHSVPFHNQHIDFISMSQSISTYFQYEHVLSMKNNVVCLVDALGFLTSHDFVVFPTLVWVIYTAHSLK